MDSLLEKKLFSNFSHLYYWQGTDTTLIPVILMAHIDVVRVIDKNLDDWQVPPFQGMVKNDTVWGRGAIDDKVGLISIMEAVEKLLCQKNF